MCAYKPTSNKKKEESMELKEFLDKGTKKSVLIISISIVLATVILPLIFLFSLTLIGVKVDDGCRIAILIFSGIFSLVIGICCGTPVAAGRRTNV